MAIVYEANVSIVKYIVMVNIQTISIVVVSKEADNRRTT